MSNPLAKVTVCLGSLEEAIEIHDSKEETWENLKEIYPDFILDYRIEIGENGIIKVAAYIYDKE